MIEERWLNGDLGRLFVKTWGTELPAASGSAPIVLFHDSLGCVELWRDFPDRLAAATGRVVIAYDRLGFGQSDPHPGRLRGNFVRAEIDQVFPMLLQQLGLDDFVAFGHSVGGAMATVCAGKFPQQCRALVTESAQAFAEDRTLEGIRNAKRAFENEGQLERLRKYHGDKASWVLSAWTDTWLAPDFSSWSLDADLPLVRCPVLAIHGEHDEYGSIRHPERIGALVGGPATVEILPNCGHVPHREKADIVIGAVRNFLTPIVNRRR
jgi:pimeloyl-ACP methyl ester carboxylesterase